MNVLQLFLQLFLHFYNLGSLTDKHIIQLSQRISSGPMLLELGINVLQLQYEVIDTAFDNYKNDIQGAAYSVLSTWYEVQTNKQQAFMDLYSAIKKSKIKLFATELCAWV